MIKNRDIIIVGLQPWDIGIGSNCKDIAQEFSKNQPGPLCQLSARQNDHAENGSDPMVIKRMDAVREAKRTFTESQNLWILNPSTMLESISRMPWDWLSTGSTGSTTNGLHGRSSRQCTG